MIICKFIITYDDLVFHKSMTLSPSEIVLLTTVAVLGVAAIATSKTTPEEPAATPVTMHPHPKNTIVIEEID